MADEKLGTFKVGDAYRQPVGATKKKASEESQANQNNETLGFARIEGIIEKEDPAAISASLTTLHNALDELASKGNSTNKEKSEAQKAMVAIERAADLLDYLFQTKAKLVEQATQPKK
jgi:hypothetical protein